MVGLGKIFGRSVKNFGRPGQFLKVWEKIRNVREKISEKMCGKKFGGQKFWQRGGQGEGRFREILSCPPQKYVLPPQMPPPQIPRPGAATGRTKNESNVKARKSGVAESAGLSAYLQKMYPCEWETQVDYFLRGNQNSRFGVKGMVEKGANDAVEHVRREPIQIK